MLVASCDITGACPVTALKDYISSRDRLHPSAPHLFLTQQGRPPTRSWFLKRFHLFFGNNKSGHSMRSGGASAMAQAGLPLDHIQDAGRWSSEAFKTYVRDHPILRLRAHVDHPLALYWHTGAYVNFN